MNIYSIRMESRMTQKGGVTVQYKRRGQGKGLTTVQCTHMHSIKFS